MNQLVVLERNIFLGGVAGAFQYIDKHKIAVQNAAACYTFTFAVFIGVIGGNASHVNEMKVD